MDKLLIAVGAALIAPFLLILGLVLGALVGLVLAYPTMWAWNYALPPLFGLPAISYWQAFSLYILSHLLIRSSNSNSCK